MSRDPWKLLVFLFLDNSHLLRSAFYRDLNQVDQVWRTQFPERLEGFCPGFDGCVYFFLEDSKKGQLVLL
jgi:hypothetical protein